VARTVVGLLHPGEMGAALGRVLRERGHTVLWASSGRSAATARRAEAAGLEDAGIAEAVAERSDVVLSVCPPHAAEALARSVAGVGGGVFVDANAISPATARAIAGRVEEAGGRFADGGIVGSPPVARGATRLYLSGKHAPAVAALFRSTLVDARVLSSEVGTASAMKMVYAAWTKGTAALLLAIRAVARAEGVEDALLDDWRASLPGVLEQSERAARSAGAKGWRWDAEMEEIAATFAAAGLPDGFHLAAAEIFRRSPRLDGASAEDVLAALAATS
jgi:3-hydroxyisobutyrate dehydrogenase-like beta-hydroxyacid dehydrogenase